MPVDMIGMTLRSLGFDPDAAMDQFRKLGEAFDSIGRKLDVIEKNQTALMVHLGMQAEPDPEALAMIEEQSQAYLKANGGAVPPAAVELVESVQP